MKTLHRKIAAQEWFTKGNRIPYDPQSKTMLQLDHEQNTQDLVRVFERVIPEGARDEAALWTTFLPGFPDGSYGWAHVNQYVPGDRLTPRLFVEYIGQGDSDKPSGYPYSSIERADLVEAQWRSHGIRSTYAIAFDYSSLVVLELLSRQLEQIERGQTPFTVIDTVLFVNGGLFADAHSHPWFTSPLLNTPFGWMGAWMAQRSRVVFEKMVDVLWSKEYSVTKDELAEVYDAISRRNGATFMSEAAGFVKEHQRFAERWDLRRLFLALRDTVSFHVAGSKGDVFEPNQVVKAEERLGQYGLDIRRLPGGHLTTSEHPDQLAELILEVSPMQVQAEGEQRIV